MASVSDHNIAGYGNDNALLGNTNIFPSNHPLNINESEDDDPYIDYLFEEFINYGGDVDKVSLDMLEAHTSVLSKKQRG